MMLGATGEWDDYACAPQERGCLCELGLVLTPAYEATMRARADADAAASSGQQAWAALVLGGVLALPFISLDGFRVAPLTQHKRGVALEHLTAARPQGTPRGGMLSWARWLGVCASVAIIVFGVGPFFCHYVWGGWTALQLGAWPDYTPFLPMGSFLCIETVSAPTVRWVALSFAIVMCVFSVGCTMGVVYILTVPPQWDTFGLLYLCVFGGFASVNGRAAYKLLHLVVRDNSTPFALYTAAHVESRWVLLVSGQFLVLCIYGMLWWDAGLALQHPYGPGTAMTAASWTLAGSCFFRSRENSHRCQELANDEERRLLGAGRLQSY